ncbi:MAG: hypothetical protein GTO49_13620, partial [Anaerolineae bacterium]|nr:hypothetical protein [Anaerolineae bacterium]
MFGYSALGLLAILGGNLLTIVSAWALMDLATYFLNYGLLGKPRDPGRPTIRLAANGAGLLLVIAAALVSWQSGVEGDFSGGGMSTLSSWLLVAACTFRLGLMPLHFTLPKVPGLRRGIGTLLRLLPPAAALALLARQFGHSLPPEMVPWLLAIGAVGALIGGLRWGLGGVSVEARPFLVLGVSGLGVLAAGLDAENASAAIQSAAVTLLMVGAVVSLAGIHTPWHRAAPWAAAMLLVGFPGTPSSFLVESLGKGLGDARLMWATATGILTLVVLVAGTFRRGLASLTPWEANEDFARLAYGLGIFLPVMAGIGLGFSSRPRITLEGSLVLILVLALSTLSLYALRRVPVESLGR